MPVVLINNFSKREIQQAQVQQIVTMWSNMSGIDEADITISVLRGNAQAGKEYQLIVSLAHTESSREKNESVLKTSLAQSIAQSCLIDLEKIYIL